jgi:Domain of unknown function (DUF6457)
MRRGRRRLCRSRREGITLAASGCRLRRVVCRGRYLLGCEGVRGVADLGAWLGAVGTELEVPVEEVLSQSVQDEMLALTGEIAHSVVRVAVPLTSYLMGVAVGRGVSPEEALRIVSGLLPGHDE